MYYFFLIQEIKFEINCQINQVSSAYIDKFALSMICYNIQQGGVFMAEKASTKTIEQNKKAYHDYFVEESLETGIELFGTEVKSLRQGRVNLKDSWCSIVKGELFINGMHISPYEQGNIFNKDPMRVRRLLAHKREIMRLYGCVKQQGYSLIPISIYFKNSKVKVQVGLCRGKKLYDKRQDLAAKAAKRDIERAIKEKNR